MNIGSNSPISYSSPQQNVQNAKVNTYNPEPKTTNATDVFEQTKDNSTGKKIAIGLGITGATIGAIYLAKSGKGKSIIEAVKKFFSKEENAVKDVAETVEENVIKFKDVKFCDKGFVKLVNDETYAGFTGQIDDVTKSGKKICLKYKKGKLQESIINDGEIIKRYESYDRGVPSCINVVNTKNKTAKMISSKGNHQGRRDQTQWNFHWDNKNSPSIEDAFLEMDPRSDVLKFDGGFHIERVNTSGGLGNFDIVQKQIKMGEPAKIILEKSFKAK